MLNLLLRWFNPPDTGLESIRGWRQHVLSMILGGLVILGTLVAVPSVVLALRQGLWQVAVTDAVILALGILLWLKRSWSPEVRGWGLCLLMAVLGVSLLALVGVTSQIYLMIAPALAAILLGWRPALFFLAFNAVCLFTVGYFGNLNFHLPGFDGQPFMQWLVVTLNFVFVNAVITATVLLLLRGLEQSFNAAMAANRAKSEFLANMSHEIRTPMHAILGMLKLTRATSLTPKQFDYINKSEGAAKTLLALINDVLDFSKIEADKLVIDNHPFRLDTLMRDLSVVLAPNTLHKPVEVLFDLDPDLPGFILGDGLRLQQVLTNLGGNSVKFTQRGQVVIRLKKKVPGELSDPPTVGIEFSVEDTGIGIAPEQQERIFSGFAQAEGSTTRKYGGTGLGLAISKKLVQAMGGTLELVSDLDKGARFFFTLHVTALKDVPAELLQPEVAFPARRRVLVVDDNPQAADILARMCTSWSAGCDIASSGPEAIARCRSAMQQTGNPYDLILLDCQMADMDGWQTAREIRALYAESPPGLLHIIMVSANGRVTLADRTEKEQQLLDGLLVKPFTAAMLLAEIRNAQTAAPNVRRVNRSPAHVRSLTGLRILVVEDNLTNQQVAEELLVAQGAFVALAANGQLGVEAVAAAQPQFDVILMDVQMPVLDGYDATRQIRSHLGLKHLPIVGLTANALAADRAACLQAGMTEHVGKPFDLSQLVSLLIRVTGHIPPERQAITDESGHSLQQDPVGEPDLSPTEDLDIGPALKRLGGMQALYIRSAVDFSAALASLSLQVDALLQSMDVTALAALAHSCKGTSATLGLVRLSPALGQLEKMCKSNPSRSELVEQVRELHPLIDSARIGLEMATRRLDPGHSARPSVAASDASAGLAKAVLLEMIPLLEASDLGVLEMFAQRRDDLGPLPKDVFTRLENAMQDLDLEAALDVCRDASR